MTINTKHVYSTLPETKKVEKNRDSRLSATAHGIAVGLNKSISNAHWLTLTGMPTQICAKAPKVAEAERQIKRVQPYLNWLSSGEANSVDGEGLNTSICLLYALAAGPAPVPIMSVGNDGKAGLFLSCGNKSIEIIATGSSIEYYINEEDGVGDVFEEEKVVEGRVPAKLLGWLYSKFAENKLA